MKKTKRAAKRLQDAQPIYARHRQGVFALAYMTLCNEDEAFNFVSNVFSIFTRKITSIKRKPDPNIELFRIAFEQLRKTKEKAIVSDPGCDERVVAIKTALSEKQAEAWLLRRYGAVSFVNIGKLLKVETEAVQQLFTEADGIVMRQLQSGSSDDAFGTLKEIISPILNAKDPWSDIEFRLEKHYDTGRRIELSIVALLLGIALYFAGKEAYALVRVMAMPDYAMDGIAVTMEQGNPDYWRNNSRVDSLLHPNISASLYEELQGMGDDTLVRVDFSFYDSSIMEGLLTDDGRNLLQLYADTFVDTSTAAKVDLIIITGFMSFYSRYEMPWMPEDREKDFYPPAATFYQYVMDIINARIAVGNQEYINAVEAYSDVFGSIEGFNSYLGTEFVAIASWLNEIVYYELAMEDYWQNTERYSASEANELRECYELAIFRFTNGNLGAMSTAAYKMTNEQAAYLMYNRSDLGKKLYEQLDSIVESFEFTNCVDNTIFDGRMCSYSADMTKAQIMELAIEDGRFSFDGIAIPMVQKGYSAKIDPLLYSMMVEDIAHKVDTNANFPARAYLKNEKYIVYVINDTYYDYSYNYLLSLQLPDGFVNSLYELHPTMKNSAMELDYGYVYQVKYGHSLTLSEYGVLRRTVLYPNDYIVTTRYKYMTLIGNPRQ